MTVPPIISVQHVHKQFKKVHAVNDVSLTIERGEFVGLLGPNGAGKTTLVEMIEGILKPDSGTISIAGQNWQHHEAELRRIMGLCLQETRYIDRITVAETVALFANIYQVPPGEQAAFFTTFGMTGFQHQYVNKLSGGQRQKLSLCLALINKPEVLILDEPTTGLDPRFRRDIWNILMDYKHSGLTLILTTHYMEEAEFLCDRILLMNGGRIIKKGTVNELLADLGTDTLISFSVQESGRTPDLSSLNQVTDFTWQEKQNSGVVKTVDATELLCPLISVLHAQQFTVSRIESNHRTLEDVFVSVTGRGFHD